MKLPHFDVSVVWSRHQNAVILHHKTVNCFHSEIRKQCRFVNLLFINVVMRITIHTCQMQEDAHWKGFFFFLPFIIAAPFSSDARQLVNIHGGSVNKPTHLVSCALNSHSHFPTPKSHNLKNSSSPATAMTEFWKTIRKKRTFEHL